MLTIRSQQMQTLAQASAGRRLIMPCHNTETFVEIRLLDDDNQPVANAKYRIQLPDSSLQEGVLDHNGKARVEHIQPGLCIVTFPEIDAHEWSPA